MTTELVAIGLSNPFVSISGIGEQTRPEGQAKDDNIFVWVKDVKQRHATICARYETDPSEFGRQYKAKIYVVVVGEYDPVCSYHSCGLVKACYTDPKGENATCNDYHHLFCREASFINEFLYNNVDRRNCS